MSWSYCHCCQNSVCCACGGAFHHQRVWSQVVAHRRKQWYLCTVTAPNYPFVCVFLPWSQLDFCHDIYLKLKWLKLELVFVCQVTPLSFWWRVALVRRASACCMVSSHQSTDVENTGWQAWHRLILQVLCTFKQLRQRMNGTHAHCNLVKELKTNDSLLERNKSSWVLNKLCVFQLSVFISDHLFHRKISCLNTDVCAHLVCCQIGLLQWWIWGKEHTSSGLKSSLFLSFVLCILSCCTSIDLFVKGLARIDVQRFALESSLASQFGWP